MPVVEEERLVVFKIGPREPQGLTITDAKQIVEHLVENQLHVLGLRSRIQRAVRQGGGDVVVDEAKRVALMLALQGVDAQSRLTDDERALLAVALEPIKTTEQ